MSLEQDRLLALIEFAKQSARLRSTPASTVASHKLFSLYEHQVQGHPGIHLNVDAQDGGDELWLVVDPLHESKPPDVNGPLLLSSKNLRSRREPRRRAMRGEDTASSVNRSPAMANY